MSKQVKGSFAELDGNQYYKIENYDCMEDFFMTITSSSDVWNFCWSHGGITAGRINSTYALFPYYTADKVSDGKVITGSYTAVAVKDGDKTTIWEPFAPLLCNTGYKYRKDEKIQRNLYKNANGTAIWFEEINSELGLAFRYGWTSSAEFGLVKKSCIKNISGKALSITVLDGCRNIMPSCIDADLVNTSSELLDAYKRTDLNPKSNIATFALSSVLTDKAEPSECLLANTSWFTTEDKILLTTNAVEAFFCADGDASKIEYAPALKGGKPGCFIVRKRELAADGCDKWAQVFDTNLNAAKIAALEGKIADRKAAAELLEKDIAATDALMTAYIGEADGLQKTAETMTCVHHSANVMFNIMRGGFFADNGKINVPDLLAFISVRNKAKVPAAQKVLGEYATKFSVPKETLEEIFKKSGDPQLERLFTEYMPIIFSRRHGDPSRPWNKFNIKLTDNSGNPILNYEGNWRDIFQNWEALAMSYPAYIKNMSAKFLNAMTAEGFNPYRITREGIDWEKPDPKDPWAQYGYWGDHQVIYFEKLLELWSKINRADLLSSLNEAIYTSANIPYRLVSYKEICKDPRSTIDFDEELSNKLIAESAKEGTDKKLIQGKDGQPALVSLTAKILQIVVMKTANLVPGGGIWMNTQRPEWNDANNALAGYGLSVVTLCYLNRMLSFLKNIYSATSLDKFSIPKAEAECMKALSKLYASTDAEKTVKSDAERKAFTDKAGALFEAERNEFYKNGYNGKSVDVTKAEILESLENFQKMVMASISANKREDGLYHSYNTMKINKDGMEIVYLDEMLEGQVAVLSSGLLDSKETLELTKALKSSRIYEQRQNSYILYPNKELAAFYNKNNLSEAQVSALKDLVARSGDAILIKDVNGTYHFNPTYKNARIMQDTIAELPKDQQPNAAEMEALLNLYEASFNHQNFTGRSGTFYAYEGLGSIYWHMCSKLLLAVQEHALDAFDKSEPEAAALTEAYYDVRSGLSFNKTPELYGAFPSDPYSHTPFGKGARQPGMTGQVKEEVLTRWGELGVSIVDGKAQFKPVLLKDSEFFADKTLEFTWCSVPVKYTKTGTASIKVVFADGTAKDFAGVQMDEATTQVLFNRNGKIKNIEVTVA